MKKTFLSALSSLLMLSSAGFAYEDSNYNDKEYPNFSGEVLFEYVADNLMENSDKVKVGDDRTQAFLNVEPVFKFNMGKRSSLKTAWQLRPVETRLYQNNVWAGNSTYVVGGNGTDDHYGKEDYIERDTHWNDYGLIIEELMFDFRGEDIAFGAGKFNPTFGKAHDKSKYHGIYGTWIPEEYELREKLGGYVGVILDNAEINVSVFFDDITDLSRSAFKDRERDKSLGGAGNTERPNNYAVTLDGTFNKFGYNVGFRQLNGSRAGERDEKGFIGGLDYLLEFDTSHFIFIPFVEVAYFDNYDAMLGRDVWYVTTSLPLLYKGWNFLISMNSKHDSEPTYKDYRGYLIQFSTGYKFKNGLMLDIARKEHKYVEKVNYISSPQKQVRKADSWAMMVSYMLKF